jgi:hypothetical protein
MRVIVEAAAATTPVAVAARVAIITTLRSGFNTLRG